MIVFCSTIFCETYKDSVEQEALRCPEDVQRLIKNLQLIEDALLLLTAKK